MVDVGTCDRKGIQSVKNSVGKKVINFIEVLSLFVDEVLPDKAFSLN